MIDLHLSAFAPRWRFLYVVRIDAYLLSSDSGTFSLTSNEYATAHQLGESFILCLMVQSETGIAVTYIRNPIETVQLEKRVKQWEWFCSGFDGERQFYPY